MRIYGKAKSAKAERRLKRELADKDALQSLVGTIGRTASEFLRTAHSSPPVAYSIGISAAALAHNTGLLSPFERNFIYAMLGAGAAGEVIGRVVEALPFSGDNTTRSANAPGATALTFVETPQWSFSVGPSEEKK